MSRPRQRSPQAISRDLEAAYYFHKGKIETAEEELNRPGISLAYQQDLKKIIDDSRAEMKWLRERDPGLTPNSGHYVWVMGRGDVPLQEPAIGPFDLVTAKTTARIAATKGAHDRAVSSGLDPLASSFRIVRRYRAHTGERII